MDDYEREQMPGVGEVLLRQKIASPRWLQGLMIGLPVGGAGIGAGALAIYALMTSGSTLPALAVLAGGGALAAMFAVLNVTFSTARIAISAGEIHVQLGFAGPRVPIADVASVKLAPSGSNRMGMGVRNDLRGTTTYTLWGRNDRAVHLERTDGTKLVLVVPEPDAVARAIEEAMARHARAGPRVRVEVDGGAEVDDREDSEDQRVAAERAERG